jgi:hypothetical protein
MFILPRSMRIVNDPQRRREHGEENRRGENKGEQIREF